MGQKGSSTDVCIVYEQRYLIHKNEWILFEFLADMLPKLGLLFSGYYVGFTII